MTVPTPVPPEPPLVAGEREMLTSFLNFYREVMVRKVEGLEHEALTWSSVASGTCLGGLIKHLAYVERSWFQHRWAGREVDFPWSDDDPDADFRVAEGDTAESLVAFYRSECDESRRIVSDAPSLDATVESPRGDRSLRWIMVHMLEETARHAGHADLLREQVDGSVGD